MKNLIASLKKLAEKIIPAGKEAESGKVGKWMVPSVLLLGLALRLWGIGYGLPASFIFDESVIVNKAAAMGGGDLNPHFFGYPTFFIYLTAFFYGLLFILGRLTGLIASVQDFQSVFFTNPSAFFLTVRLISCMFGLASIWLVWRLAKNLYSEPAGVTAALLMCVCFAHVQDSRFAFINIPLSFWMTLSLFFLCRITCASGKLWKYYVLAGFFFGLALSTKYTAVYLIIPFVCSHFIRLGRTAFGRAAFPEHLKLAVSLALSAAVLFAASPFVFLDYNTFMTYYYLLAPRLSSASFDFYSYLHSCWKSLVVVKNVVGMPIFMLAAAGLLLGLIRRNLRELPLHIYIVSYIFIFLARLNLSHIPPRYVDPLLPAIFVFAAGALHSVYVLLPKARAAVWTAAMLLLVYQPLGDNFTAAALLCRKDTRTAAKEWIERNIPDRSAVAVRGSSYHFPPVRESRSLMRDKYDFIITLGKIRNGNYSDIFSGPRNYAVKLSLPQYPPSPSYHIYELVDGFEKLEIPKTWELLADSGFGSLKAKGIRCVILLDHPVLPPSDAGRRLEEKLSASAKLVFEAEPVKKDYQADKGGLNYETDADIMPISGWSNLEFLGPRICIYRI